MRTARFLLLSALVLLGGCEQTFRDMYQQPRYKPLAASPLWPDGRASRPEVAGTIPRSEGTAAGSSSGRLGTMAPAPVVDPLDTVRDTLQPKNVAAAKMRSIIRLPAVTRELLDRGRSRFDIFCAPCHSIAGDGDGVVARRGFPHPPSFHSDALREASDAHFYAVITDGYGAMHSYATRVEPDDRLAIIAYIRALQLSHHAPLSSVPEAQRSRLASTPPDGSSTTGVRR